MQEIVMKKFLLFCLCAVVLMFTGCATLQGVVGQPQLKKFTFVTKDHTYEALLPEQIPKPTTDKCTYKFNPWGFMGVLHAYFNEGKEPVPVYPAASFWFLKEMGVIGVVWHTLNDDRTLNHDTYIYIKGIPIHVPTEKFDAFIHKLMPKQPESTSESVPTELPFNQKRI